MQGMLKRQYDMDFQRKTAKNIGKDTFVRQYQGNNFQQQNSQTFQMMSGEIEFTEPEPLFRQNMVAVKPAKGGRITSVAYPGAFIDPISGNLHGTYEGPIPGQMVMVGFENGNVNSPFVVNRYPYQGAGNTLTELKYINPLTASLFDSTDVMMGHFSGSYMSFNTGILSGKTPGSFTLSVLTDVEIISNTTIVTLSALSHVALNGNTNFAVKYTEMKTAFDNLKTQLNNFITVFNGHKHGGVDTGVGVSLIPDSSGTSATADMAASKNTKVLM